MFKENEMSFNPNFKGTIQYTANGSSQNLPLPPGGGLVLRVQNSGANIAFIETTSDANLPCTIPGATPGGTPIFTNQPPVEILMHVGATNIAFISQGNSTLFVTRGDIN